MKTLVEHCVTYARTIPISEAIPFLRDLCKLLGDTPEAAPVRDAYMHLHETDRQLELIQSPQLRLALSSKKV